MNDPVSFDLDQDFVDEVQTRNAEAVANGTAVRPQDWHETKASVDTIAHWGMLIPAMVIGGVLLLIISELTR